MVFMNDSKLTILGSGTCNLRADKAAASVLIEQDGVRLVYDFGRGVAVRLVEAGLKQDDIEHIFLSHFHSDHVTDLLPYLHAASWSQIDKRSKDLHVYGPEGLADFIGKLFAVFGWQREMSRGYTVHVHELHGDTLRIGDARFDVADLHHSHGLRFGEYAVAGDANLNDDLVALLRGAHVGIFDAGHLMNDEIIDLAVRSQVKKLLCSHQYRELDPEALNVVARKKGYLGEIIIAHDLMRV